MTWSCSKNWRTCLRGIGIDIDIFLPLPRGELSWETNLDATFFPNSRHGNSCVFGFPKLLFFHHVRMRSGVKWQSSTRSFFLMLTELQPQPKQEELWHVGTAKNRWVISLFFNCHHFQIQVKFQIFGDERAWGALWSCQVLHAANYAKVSFDKRCMEAEVRWDSINACNAMMPFDAARCHVMPSLLLTWQANSLHLLGYLYTLQAKRTDPHFLMREQTTIRDASLIV